VGRVWCAICSRRARVRRGRRPGRDAAPAGPSSTCSAPSSPEEAHATDRDGEVGTGTGARVGEPERPPRSASSSRRERVESVEFDRLLVSEDVSVEGEQSLSPIVGKERIQCLSTWKRKELNFERQRLVLIPPATAAVQQPRAVAAEQPQHFIFVLLRPFSRPFGRISHERDSYRLFRWSHASTAPALGVECP